VHKTSPAPKTTAQQWAEVYSESFEGCRGLGLLRFERKKWLGPGGIADERALEIIRTRNFGLIATKLQSGPLKIRSCSSP